MSVRAETQIDLARVDDGSPGANGATFTPSVDSSGNISWTNDGGLPNPQTQNIMGPSSQYFWYETSGADAGAHITEVPQDEWSDVSDPNYHSGGNMIAQSTKIAIRDGMTEMATFGADGQSFNNDNGYEVLRVGKLPTDNYASKLNWTAYNNESPFSYELPWACDSISSVKYYDSSYALINGVTASYTLSGNSVVFDAAACSILQSNNVAYIRVTYSCDGKFPYFTFGSDGLGDIGKYSIREGENCVASGNTSHAEGESTTASGSNSHAEGYITTASGLESHAEGARTSASGIVSHAEGSDTIASGDIAHAEGSYTTASGDIAHAEGCYTIASAAYSHAQNLYTKASSNSQTALGKFNIEDNADTYAVIVGNGTADNARANAFMVDWNGDIYPQATKMTDFIVETGSTTAGSVTWKYRKYNSGVLEMWGDATTTLAIGTASGAIYTTASEYDVAVPTFVASTDFITGELSGGGWLDVTSFGSSSPFVAPKIRLYAPTSYGSASRYIRYYFKGTWA